jgi:hypothetical protein
MERDPVYSCGSRFLSLLPLLKERVVNYHLLESQRLLATSWSRSNDATDRAPAFLEEKAVGSPAGRGLEEDLNDQTFLMSTTWANADANWVPPGR